VTPKSLRHLVIPLLALSIGACTPANIYQAGAKMTQVAMNPEIPVGANKDQPSVATVTLYAEAGVNKNGFGQPSPVDVWLYQLSDDGKLKTIDFMTMSADPKTALGTSYISHKDFQIEPGKAKIVDDWEFDKDARFIGVAAGYQNIDKVNWRAVEDVHPKGEKYKITVAVKVADISIQVDR
jgi:type VI secretion system protein VasD